MIPEKRKEYKDYSNWLRGSFKNYVQQSPLILIYCNPLIRTRTSAYQGVTVCWISKVLRYVTFKSHQITILSFNFHFEIKPQIYLCFKVDMAHERVMYEANEIKWLLIIITCIAVFSIIINMIGMSVLVKLKEKHINQNQKVLFIALCSVELLLGITIIARSLSLMFQCHRLIRKFIILIYVVILTNTYFVIMLMITIDRYLAIRLKLKYPIHCTPALMRKVLYISLSFYAIAFSACFTVAFYYHIDLEIYIVIYLYPVTEFSFIVTVVISYYKIYEAFKQSQRIALTLRKISSLSDHRPILKNKYKIYIPTLIIVTFVLFTIVPNLLLRISSLSNFKTKIFSFGRILYPIGWCIDPLVYICSTRYVKRKISETSFILS